MEPLDVVDQLLHVYDDISAELGSVLALLFLSLFVIIVVVVLSMFINGRSNARMRSAQSDTLRTINDLVRTQSEREEKSTEEAKRLNDMLLNQTIDFNNRFNEQAQRLTTLEVKVPIYEAEITDLKSTRDTLMTVLQEERREWHDRERVMEERHLSDMSDMRDKFDQTIDLANNLKSELAEVRAELRAREIERTQYRQENQRANQIVSELVSMQASIDKLAKVIIDEFSKFTQFASVVPLVVDGSNIGTASDGTGHRSDTNSGQPGRGRKRRSAGSGDGNGGKQRASE